MITIIQAQISGSGFGIMVYSVESCKLMKLF